MDAIVVSPPRLAEMQFQVLPWYRREEVEFSEFDVLLRQKWQESLGKGVFLHRVESEPIRIPGNHGYVGVLCRNRASQKRKPQSFIKLTQEHNPNSFNFTKVREEEILMKIEMQRCSDRISENGHGDKKFCHVVINNSPYEYGHSLLVPQLEKLLIQSIDLDSIKFGIEILLRSSHPGFRVMYNSLCAGASVNHLHLHCYYTEYWLSSEIYRMHPLQDDNNSSGNDSLLDCFEIEHQDSAVRGFGFIITRNNYDVTLPKKIYKIVNHFIDQNIAHNIVIIRGVPPNLRYLSPVQKVKTLPNGIHTEQTLENREIQKVKNDDLPYGGVTGFAKSDLRTHSLIGRVYLFPRKPLLGAKCYRKFLVNVTELFDHLYFGDVDVFNSMSEEDITLAKQAVSLTCEDFKTLKTSVIEVLSDAI